MECLLKKEFGVENVLDLHVSNGGCINMGHAYQVGPTKMFIKTNHKNKADVMFNGEYESLLAIAKTETIRVPKVFKTFSFPHDKGHAIAMEYLELSSLSKHCEQLGYDLAKLHLHNIKKMEMCQSNQNRLGRDDADSEPINQYGFHVTTCCGFIPLDNTWSSDWVEFYSRQRLQNKVERILAEDSDRELNELWSELQLKISDFFKGITVQPSLIHGDLWTGNAGQITETPVIFDPGSFYAHHEFEMSITDMFGSFDQSFYKAYHSLIPKSRGFELRHQLYLLFHYLNHRDHFGRSYRPQSLAIMRRLLEHKKV